MTKNSAIVLSLFALPAFVLPALVYHAGLPAPIHLQEVPTPVRVVKTHQSPPEALPVINLPEQVIAGSNARKTPSRVKEPLVWVPRVRYDSPEVDTHRFVRNLGPISFYVLVGDTNSGRVFGP
jgi:hypothetical protein